MSIMAFRSSAAHANTISSSTRQSAVEVGSSVTNPKPKGTSGSASKHSLASFLASPSTIPPYPQPSSVPKAASSIPPALPSPLPPMPELEKVEVVHTPAPWANVQPPVAVPIGVEEEEVSPTNLEPLFDATPLASSPFASDTGRMYSSAELSAMLHEAMLREGKMPESKMPESKTPVNDTVQVDTTPFQQVQRRQVPNAPMKPRQTFARGPNVPEKKSFAQLSAEQEAKRAEDKQNWRQSIPDLRTMPQHSTVPFVPPQPRFPTATAQQTPQAPTLPFIPKYAGRVPFLPVCAPPAPEAGFGHFGATKTNPNKWIQEYTFQPQFTPANATHMLPPATYECLPPMVQHMVSESAEHFAATCIRSVFGNLKYLTEMAVEHGSEFKRTHPLPDAIVCGWYPSNGDLAFSGSNHILHPKFPGVVNTALKEHLTLIGLPHILFVQVYFNMKFGYSLKFTTLRRPQPVDAPRRLPPPLPTMSSALPPPLPVQNPFGALSSASPTSGGDDE